MDYKAMPCKPWSNDVEERNQCSQQRFQFSEVKEELQVVSG